MQKARVNEIDLLRFIAAVAVMLFHYSFRGHAADDFSIVSYPLLAPSMKYGYLGVQLFFMISGFVILMTAAGGNLAQFTKSRIIRLYPAYWACCTVTFLFTLALGAPRFVATFPQYLANMTMLNGFTGVPSIDGVYWSLNVELRFYILVAAILAIRRIDKSQMFLIAWLIISIAVEMMPNPLLRFIFFTDYSAFFIAGAEFYLIWSQGFSPTRIAMVLICWGLATYDSMAFVPTFEKLYKSDLNGFAIAAIITSFFIVMALVAAKKTGKFGEKNWVAIGALTYPLYLLHQHIGYMIFDIAYPAVNLHVLFWGVVAAMIVSSYAVHRFIEKPSASTMKKLLNKLSERKARGTAQIPLPAEDA